MRSDRGEDEFTRQVTVGDTAFSFLDSGVGEAIVFLHGIGSGARSWVAQVRNLGQGNRVIAWDAPGYGASSAVVRSKPDASDYAGRLKVLADALDLGRMHLVGHSLGAVVAARFAREHRHRVSSLTLASPSSGHARLPADERERLRRGRLEDLQRLGPEGLARARGPRLVSPGASDAARAAVIETMSRIRPDGYAQAVELLSGADTLADVETLEVALPVQFIIGALDAITPPQATLAIAAKRPAAQVHVVEGCGHALYLERPEVFVRLIADFVASIAPLQMAEHGGGLAPRG
jgi:pimeloyl-ACP methyl ester carboxylesterase